MGYGEATKINIICFTRKGLELGCHIKEKIAEDCFCFGPARFIMTQETGNVRPLPEDIRAWIASVWGKEDFLFIGAAGIAVRMTAHCVKDKYTDSAVLVMDERGQYVIPLLSGHMGGGVKLARQIAETVLATAVITTATDVQGTFAIDVFAKEEGFIISDRERAKALSAALLEGETIGAYVDNEIPGVEGIRQKLAAWANVKVCGSCEEAVSLRHRFFVAERQLLLSYDHTLKKESFEEQPQETKELLLLAKNLVVGVGCRKGSEKETLEEGIRSLLEKQGCRRDQVQAIVSIDLKKEEPGIVGLAREWAVPFITYSAEELMETGPVSSTSAFVEQITGADNVCERAVKRYMVSGGGGEVLLAKTCMEGMTVAVGACRGK